MCRRFQCSYFDPMWKEGFSVKSGYRLSFVPDSTGFVFRRWSLQLQSIAA